MNKPKIDFKREWSGRYATAFGKDVYNSTFLKIVEVSDKTFQVLVDNTFEVENHEALSSHYTKSYTGFNSLDEAIGFCQGYVASLIQSIEQTEGSSDE